MLQGKVGARVRAYLVVTALRKLKTVPGASVLRCTSAAELIMLSELKKNTTRKVRVQEF